RAYEPGLFEQVFQEERGSAVLGILDPGPDGQGSRLFERHRLQNLRNQRNGRLQQRVQFHEGVQKLLRHDAAGFPQPEGRLMRKSYFIRYFVKYMIPLLAPIAILGSFSFYITQQYMKNDIHANNAKMLEQT